MVFLHVDSLRGTLLPPGPDFSILGEPIHSAKFFAALRFDGRFAGAPGLRARKETWYSLFFRGDSGNSPGASES
jgi:hypothetical protein